MTTESRNNSSNNQSATASWLKRIDHWADSPAAGSFAPWHWFHAFVRIVLISLREMESNRLTLRSGALTYALLLSMVPMLAMSTAVIKGLGGNNQLREVVYSYIDTMEQSAPLIQNTPASEESETAGSSAPQPSTSTENSLTGHLRIAVDKIFAYVDRTNFATLGTFGMLGIFLSVILVLGQIETAMNTIWHVKNARSILRKITDYLTLMVLIPISINVALAAGAIIENDTLAFMIDNFIPKDWIQTLLLEGVPISILSITIYIIYIFFPNTKLKKFPTMIGAILAGIMWFVTQNLYISMQVGVAKYNAIYGSFASIPLFLAWVYLGWLFVLLGAQVAFAIQNNPHYQLIDRPATSALQLSGALDMCNLVASRFSTQKGTKMADITIAYPFYQLSLLEDIRDTLIAGNILHHSEENGEIMPSLPSEALTNHRIIEAVLGSEPPATDGGRTARKAVKAALQAFPASPDNKQDELLTTEKKPEAQVPKSSPRTAPTAK